MRAPNPVASARTLIETIIGPVHAHVYLQTEREQLQAWRQDVKDTLNRDCSHAYIVEQLTNAVLTNPPVHAHVYLQTEREQLQAWRQDVKDTLNRDCSHAYIVEQLTNAVLTNPDAWAQGLETLKDYRQEREVYRHREALLDKLQTMAPVEQLTNAVLTNPDAWAQGLETLKDYRQEREVYRHREALLDKLQTMAPDWAMALRTGLEGFTATLPSNDLDAAWRWKQLERLYTYYTSVEVEALQADCTRLSADSKALRRPYPPTTLTQRGVGSNLNASTPITRRSKLKHSRPIARVCPQTFVNARRSLRPLKPGTKLKSVFRGHQRSRTCRTLRPT